MEKLRVNPEAGVSPSWMPITFLKQGTGCDRKTRDVGSRHGAVPKDRVPSPAPHCVTLRMSLCPTYHILSYHSESEALGDMLSTLNLNQPHLCKG